jgi:hypothetical protein
MEAFYCNFGLNREYQTELERSGLEVTGKDQEGKCGSLNYPDIHSSWNALRSPGRVRGRKSPPADSEFCRTSRQASSAARSQLPKRAPAS